MKDELQQLEQELASMQPVKPPAALKARLDDAFEEASEEQRSSRVILWRGLLVGGLAAAAALTFAVLRPVEEAPADATPGAGEVAAVETSVAETAPLAAIESPGPRYRPVSAVNRIAGVRDEGVAFVEDSLPVRRYRYQFVDTITFVNQEDGSQIEMEIPREEIVYVPINTL